MRQHEFLQDRPIRVADEQPPSGSELMARAQQGDSEAFSQLCLKEAHFLHNVARKLAGDAAEDVVQTTLLNAWEHRGSFVDRGEGPRPWLYTICRNAGTDERRKSLRSIPIDPLEDAYIFERAPKADKSAEDAAIATFEDAAVRMAVRDLPAPFNRTVEAIDLDDQANVDYAAQANIPRGTVGSQLHRGRRELARRVRTGEVHLP